MSSITKAIMLILISCESVFAFVGTVALHLANILSPFANMKIIKEIRIVQPHL